jgi:serine/threonine protein kinase
MLSLDGFVKLSDFGFAKVIGDGRTYTPCGTPEYVAPELLDTTRGHGKNVDWWALGVLIYEILAGRTPFAAANSAEICCKILARRFNFPKVICDEASRDLVNKLLTTDESARLGSSRGAADIREHPWFMDIAWANLRDKTMSVPENVVRMGLAESMPPISPESAPSTQSPTSSSPLSSGSL